MTERNLIISDFLANYLDSINDQYEVYPLLVDIYERYENEDVEELFNRISMRMAEQDRRLIPSLIYSISLLDIDQNWPTLMNREKSELWPQRVEELILEKSIKMKLCEPLSAKFISVLAKRFVLSVGTQFTKELCGVLVSIESVSSLETLFETFKGLSPVQIKRLQTEVKFNFQNRKLSIADLKILLETNILLQKIPSDVKKKPRFSRLLKAMLTNGIKMSEISKLMDISISKPGESKSPLKREGRMKAFEHIIGQASQYQIQSNLFSQLVSVLESDRSSEFIETTNKFISEGVFDGKSGVKDIHQVITEFRLKNSRQNFKWACLKERFIKVGYEWDILKLKVLKVLHGDKASKIYRPTLQDSKNICDWTKSKISAWASAAKQYVPSPEFPLNEFYLEVLMVARVAIKLHRGFDLTRVQILCCLLALQKLDKDKGRGQLQQVVTGSGKSAIIAILAVAKAVQGNFVDIYTSSPVLAERDAREWASFYAIFDGVTCDHNRDKAADYLSGEKKCYKNTIVYGDCSQFQFDYLRDKYSGLCTLGGRTCDFAIVDEADSMLLDDCSKLARLSSTLPGMDTLEIIYHFIWDRISYLKSHLVSVQDHYYYLEGKRTSAILYEFSHPQTHELIQIKNLVNYIARGAGLEFAGIFSIDDLEVFIREHLLEYTKGLTTNPKLDIKLPKYLTEFVETQGSAWVDSALKALKFEENVHYVVDEDQIKPVDFQTTGIIQSNTNWNNGLHQFLGLKHSLKIYPETLTTNFLSNLSMFEKYGENLMGFTGTLGSPTGRQILYNVYNVKLLTMPETHFKQYVQFPDVVVPTEDQWLKEIVITTLAEVSKGRGVLVICETIRTANLLSSVLLKFKVRVKLYTKNADEEQEKHVERIHPGDVIVATNLAGRGTDIKTLEIEKFGGLHVCLTFLPQSQRIEEQAFGRTSRQGNKGTGQLIIVQPTDCHPLENYKPNRDLSEKLMLETFKNNELPQICKKGKLFDRFCHYFNGTRTKLLENRCWVDPTADLAKKAVNLASGGTVQLKTDQLSSLDTLVMQSIEERWAMFLRRVDDPQVSYDTALRLYNEFESEITDNFKAGSKGVLIKGLNVFAFIQLGNEEYIYKKTDTAFEYFKIAAEMDQTFAAWALAGLGSVLLVKSEANDYKEKALKHFRDALVLLHTEMAWITVKQNLVHKQLSDLEEQHDDPNTPLFQQLMEKSNLLGYFINTVEGNISGVEKSLRRVHFTGIKKEQQVTRTIPNTILSSTSKELPGNYKQFDGCRLSFHDLTFRNDSGVVDQAVDTLPKSKLLRKDGSTITCCCKSANIKDLVEGTTEKVNNFFKEVPEIRMQINGLELDKGSGKIRFNFDALKSKIGSYDLEIVGMDSVHLTKVALAIVEHYANNGISKPKHLQLTTTCTEDTTTSSVIETVGIENSSAISGKSGLIAVRIIGIPPSPHSIHELTLAFSKYLGPTVRVSPIFNLTMNCIEKDKTPLIETWTTVLSQYNNSVLYLSNMSTSQAEHIIPLLQKTGTDFTLDIHNLDVTQAANILKSASIEQELMEQTKLQKLTEMFMPGRLPPQEILELNARGLCILISFNEKLFIPWKSVLSVCALASLQVGVGGLLITTGFGATLGMSLVNKGMSDFQTGYRAYSSRQFDWGSYRTQKAISLVISASTMGLGALKDGATGVAMLGSNTMSDAALTYTGQNLNSLAVKFVAVRGVETVAKVGLKALADNLANFCFEQLRDTIQAEVNSRVENAFGQGEFNLCITKALVIESLMFGKVKNGPSRLKKKIDGIVSSTMNPKASGWTSLWDSIGSPLANGILSDPNFVGSSWNTAVLCYGALTGLYQITTVIAKVCEEVQHKLNQARHGEYVTLLKSKGVSESVLEAMTKKIRTDLDGQLQIAQWTDESIFTDKKELKAFREFFANVDELEKKKSKAKSTEQSLIEKSVADLVTSHIIKTANSHLVSPVLSKLSGQLVGAISEELQSRFLVNDDESSKEYGSQFPRTIKGQIEGNAKEVMVTINLKEQEAICKEIAEQRKENAEGQGQVEKMPNNILDLAEDVAKTAPISSAMLTLAAKNNGQNIKIVTDENYKATDEERAAGVRVVVYDPPPPGSPAEALGHFRLKTEDCNGFVDVDRPGESSTEKTNNCGPNIIASLTGKEPQVVRNELGRTVLENPERFEKLQQNEAWFHNRYPTEANKMMGVGGERKERPNNPDDEPRKRSRTNSGTSEKDDNDGDPEDNREIYKRPVTHELIYDEDGKRKVVSTIPVDHTPGTLTRQNTETATLARKLSATKIDGWGDKPVRQVQGHGVNRHDGGSGTDPLNLNPITDSTNQGQRKSDDIVREVRGRR